MTHQVKAVMTVGVKINDGTIFWKLSQDSNLKDVLRPGGGAETATISRIRSGRCKSYLKNVKALPKQTGPVNGDECYFWRTTGCTFGSDCKWQHYPKSKGIDKKPWQKHN